MAQLAKSTPQALQHIHFPSEPCLSRRWSCAARSSAWRPSVGHCRRAAKSRMTMIEGRERQAEARKVVGAVCTRQGYACDLQFHVRTGEGSGRVRVARISSMVSTVPRGTSNSASTSRSSPSRRCRASFPSPRSAAGAGCNLCRRRATPTTATTSATRQASLLTYGSNKNSRTARSGICQS